MDHLVDYIQWMGDFSFSVLPFNEADVLVLNMLAETSTTDISKTEQPQSFSENMDVARKGGEVAGIARKALEERTGKPVITAKNASQLNAIVTRLIEDAAEKDKKE